MPTVDDLSDPVTQGRVNNWYDRFRFYRRPPSRQDIIDWIAQFESAHHALGGKVLDATVVISDEQIQAGFNTALHSLPGWSDDGGLRAGRWVFVGFGEQAESGAAMLHMFREANGLEGDAFQHMFITVADLPGMGLTAHDTVIFVDDFAGTGDQFAKRWNTFQELIVGEARIFLFLAVATSRALARLQAIDDLAVKVQRVMTSADDCFHAANGNFSAAEKDELLRYCRKASRSNPKGWGDCGLLLVISRKTPNNSLPILHQKSRKWHPIFPRRMARVAAAD